jgi:hypothetical protein
MHGAWIGSDDVLAAVPMDGQEARLWEGRRLVPHFRANAAEEKT